MNRINHTNADAASRVRSTHELVNHNGEGLLPGGRTARRTTNRRVKPFAAWVAAGGLLLSPCVPVDGGLLGGKVDVSTYDVPLHEQVVNRIKAKVAARLGEGRNTRDRYFIVPFA